MFHPIDREGKLRHGSVMQLAQGWQWPTRTTAAGDRTAGLTVRLFPGPFAVPSL